MSNWKWCVEVDGKVIKGWYEDKGKWYYLDEENGTMKTGWFLDKKDKNWYYLDETSGEMKTGWIQLNSIWYYLEPNSNGYKGACYVDCTATIDGKTYTFNKDGHMLESSLVSNELINFVKSFEGFYPNKYYDCVGVLTQGYGLTGKEIEDLPDSISEEQASNLLKEVINKNYATIIKSDLDSKGVTLKQNEFDALVSFAYNCGTDALLNQSTLYKNVLKGVRDSATIISNFQSWSNGGGKRLEGLYRRRTKEGNIFLNSDYTGNV